MLAALTAIPYVGPLLAFLASPLGRMIGIGALALAMGFTAGWRAKAKLDLTAEYRAHLKALAVERDTFKRQAESAQARAGELALISAHNEEKLRDLQLALQAQPGAPVCVLGDDGERRLRELR